MVFSSLQFLYLFFPVTLVLYYSIFFIPKFGTKEIRINVSNLLLLVMSIIFYAAGEKIWVLILLLSVSLNYYSALVIDRGIRINNNLIKRIGLVVSVLSNLSVLLYFKYSTFLIENFNMLILSSDQHYLKPIVFSPVALPLGISFYTFQSMSYNIDVYRGQAQATKSLINFACYITMFSQLVAGPIIRYRDICVHLTNRFIDRSMFLHGVKRFTWGLSKKVLIANTLSIPVEQIFSLPDGQLTFTVAWFGAILYSLQIYYDFSGYSDMAIGIGRIFGFQFPENFNYPYISKSIQDFWRRWHISLSTWFKDYLYIPLGGNRISAERTYLNLLIVFFLCGFWHGASWTFIAWGLYHGLFLIFERIGPGKFFENKGSIFGYCYALPVIIIGWVIFRTENFTQAFYYISAMTGFSRYAEPSSVGISMFLTTDILIASLAGVIFSMPVYPSIEKGYEMFRSICKQNGFADALVTGFGYAILSSVFLYASILIASGRENPFIYFRF
ncbi:MAG: MBOAT family protein [Desulfobacteraceae bacterium]|nr:MAG: MBOAT family protein [Desulfobacteraceae bacterium]